MEEMPIINKRGAIMRLLDLKVKNISEITQLCTLNLQQNHFSSQQSLNTNADTMDTY